MATNISIIKINAPIQKVWKTVTEPEMVQLWQFGSDLITTWKVGSEIRFVTKLEQQVFEQWGIIKEIHEMNC
ncbi:SRPBCC domain-containing protein [Flavobacterium sp. W22_SRS_FK3]|uniref:SRPBCC domain-containing protein n=1 Tax=Flavobacterium sp. W22_SRS_FK3 TaxID=3240275 RepID=UPI003F9243E5